MDYPIIEIEAEWANRAEPMGSKRKFWFGPPGEPRQLFKYGRLYHGEDWAEKIACEIAEMLGIPHAQIDLAACDGEPGIVTPDFRHKRGQLTHGNELMVEYVDPAYPAHGPNFRVKQHTVSNVMMVLSKPFIDIPNGLATDSLASAADVFVGYLMLDALIANTDRHHENWAIIWRDRVPTDAKDAELAPTFDHASSLGRELLDSEREARLHGRDQNRTVERYLARAPSRFFGSEDDPKPLTPMQVFWQAAVQRPAASEWWRELLAGVETDSLERAVYGVPAARMGDLAKQFAIRMLHLNRETILAQRPDDV